MKFAIASDHAGFEYKSLLIKHLRGMGYDVRDFGTYSDESTDYPDWIRPAALAVARGDADQGIVLGGSGNGEAMVANRIPGIRCAVCWSEETAALASAHNNANMISLGQRLISPAMAITIVDTWLATPFENARHTQRIEKIDAPQVDDPT